jgi:hypothetical protein
MEKTVQSEAKTIPARTKIFDADVSKRSGEKRRNKAAPVKKIVECNCAKKFFRLRYQRRKVYRGLLIQHYWLNHGMKGMEAAFYVDGLGADTITRRSKKWRSPSGVSVSS